MNVSIYKRFPSVLFQFLPCCFLAKTGGKMWQTQIQVWSGILHITMLLFRVFWDVAPCSHVEIDQHFRDVHYLHHQGDHRSDDGRQYVPLKHQSTSMWLHGSTSQKTLNFILAAMRTWNLTTKFLLFMWMGGLLFIPQVMYGYGELWRNDTYTEKWTTQRKICLSATLFYTNPTLSELGAKLGLRGDRLATNSPSHATTT
jgi:hypothetical protein